MIGSFERVVVARGGPFIAPSPGQRLQNWSERHHRAPVVIGERVRVIGGELAVESNPGKGARLEITLPQSARATYANVSAK